MKTCNKIKRNDRLGGSRQAVELIPSFLTRKEVNQFKRGDHYALFNKFGAHTITRKGVKGTYFAVWAPNTKGVAVIGDFNQWNKKAHRLKTRTEFSGIWEGFIPGVKEGDVYRYYIYSKKRKFSREKIDPFAFSYKSPPEASSIVADFKYTWNDARWVKKRSSVNMSHRPMSIYELHLGSWRRKGKNGSEYLTYREISDELVEYIQKMGFTHVEFMPVMEHPFYGCWGYQALGFFAPTSRYGAPEDLMYLIDQLHGAGIGVILDWVPSHFPCDDHGLACFDGTQLFEHVEKHPDWKSSVFNTGCHQVISFLISNALFWLEKYHIDALRVDAVASMLYLDYSRKNGEWDPNLFGGHENLESIAFLRQLNKVIKEKFPGVHVIAEESTAWSNVSKPVEQGGLGFDMKWNMGWMHDTLQYFCQDISSRDHFQDQLTFSFMYAFDENFVLSLSHDEVVHEKSSLVGKMPGRDWEKFANLRCLYGYMYGHPGKKLLFMGGEFAQWAEWNHDVSLDWHLLAYDRHQQIQEWVKDLNHLYLKERALHELDFSGKGFQWIDVGAKKQGVVCFLRKGARKKDLLLIVCHFKNRKKGKFSFSVPIKGSWEKVLSSDDKKYGGKGNFNDDPIFGKKISGHQFQLTMDLPPLSVTFLRLQNLTK